ncbi:MAG: hypothetical protein GTO12_10530 [Proteobacteria bacterium]|nr:hypothetical protein [Pseudomonadota bacterium]
MSFKTLKDSMFARLFTRFPSLVDRWAKSQNFLVYPKTPWTPLTQDLRESQIALVTTFGLELAESHRKNDHKNTYYLTRQIH